MKARTYLTAILGTCLCALALQLQAKDVPLDFSIDYPTTDKRHYMDAKTIAFVRPGLSIEMLPEDVSVGEDGTVSVMFTVTDDRGLPLDLDGVTTPGEVDMRFIIGYIPEPGDRYISYISRTQTSPITGDSAEQPTTESNGSYEKVADGVYIYTFATQLPADYDASATHTIAVQAERDLTEFDLGENVANPIVHFVPAGGTPEPREVVLTETCNNCHDPLAIHGGGRREIGYCVMCHTEGVVDPDTGSSVDMGNMVHKIHNGANLANGYVVIGFRQSVHDYSNAVYSQDVRNCQSCHVPEASQGEAWLLNPTRETCGSCHDDVNFDTGENHVGGPAISDTFCANCHFPEGELEFDSSIIGAHTIPTNSKELAGVNIELREVTNALAGELPTVRYAVTDDAGNFLAPDEIERLVMLISGPNDDYNALIRETVADPQPTGIEGEYTYTFAAPLPDLATGSYTVGAEGRNTTTLLAGTTDEMTVRDAAESQTLAFAVTDSEAVARRMVVDDALCEDCHADLSLHGDNRTNATGYCQMCHSPVADDSAVRPEDALPARSIDLRHMVHRIHTGEELDGDYTLYGFRGSLHNYNDVVYPGDLRNCEACHVNDSQQVPSGGIEWVLATENDFYAPQPPNSAACLGCHDDLDSAAHAAVNTAPFGESCGACHGEGKEFSVDRVHARIED